VQPIGTLRAAAHAFNPADLLVAMFDCFKLLAGGVRPFDKKDNSRRRDRVKNHLGRGGESTTHLEPLSYKHEPISETDFDPSRPAGITVTPPQQTGYSLGYTETAYNQPAYPQQVGYADVPRGRQSPPDYDLSTESQRLHPGGYARTHSRDSSIDEGDARSARRMV